METDQPLEIFYEDNHVLVVRKPAGILSQADDTGKPDLLNLLKRDIKQRYQKPGAVFLGLVHRLDQPVSGLMVFARTSKAASRLSEQVRTHQLGKFYLAVVKGCPEPAAGRLEDHLEKNCMTNLVRVVEPGQGQPAFLDYEVVATDPERDCSLVRITLGTGRSHQIRVQFASRGWPLLGDQRYGPSTREETQKNKVRMDLALFAYRLTFKHPTREEVMDFSISPPDTPPWSYFLTALES
ncbi:MAG: RluA family pseudouridine synthase [Clostridia bacterium]|nr:RluA family pseudouridine synthase [Clostridia bacterium]NCC74830.1 RluA family pseudouridine synthase [Clostridia bacterium]